MTSLSPEQEFAFSKLKKGENLFISGPGGSGKSYFIKYIVEYFHKHGIIHQVTSTTGCSSVLLSNNIKINNKPIIVKTIHSWSGIRLGKGPVNEIVKSVLKRPNVVKEWKICKALIIDEISMLSKKLFHLLDIIGRTIRHCELPFGGIQIICLGDFYQLPPVGDRDDPDSYSFCFESPQWSLAFPVENHIEFTTIFRQTDETFKRILQEVRSGKLSEDGCRTLMERVDVEYDSEKHEGILPIKIFATRNQVTAVNQKHYQELSGEEYVYQIGVNTNMTKYVETGLPFEEEIQEKISAMSQYEIDYECKGIIQNIPVEESFGLKNGAIVMCLVNLDLTLGIANGSLGRIIGFTYSPISKQEIPIVHFINGIVQQIDVYTWQSSEYPNICVSQIPLCLAYANSIHKMQGSTLDVCEMNLGNSIFTEHQTYVALSRVRSLDGLYLTAFHPQKIKVHPKVVEFYSKFTKIPADNTVDNIEEETVPPYMSEKVKPNIGECPICLARCDKPYITLCKHVFCQPCIIRYLQCNLHGNASCPMCRESITFETLKPLTSTKSWRSSSNPFGNYSYKVTKMK